MPLRDISCREGSDAGLTADPKQGDLAVI